MPSTEFQTGNRRALQQPCDGSPIRVVLHGGLGNQLFQYFRGRLEAEVAQRRIYLLASFLGRYQTARGLELDPLLLAEQRASVSIQPADLTARMRLPKLLWRLTGRELLLTLPRYGTLVDGYYQWPQAYRRYDAAVGDKVLSAWRQALAAVGILQKPIHQRVTHVRLGDFFKSTQDARAFARARLQALPAAGDLVTDQEDIIRDALADIGSAADFRIIPTAHLSAWDLIKLLTTYRVISTNGSTLALWAAVFSCAALESSNADHMEIRRRLAEHAGR